jgi:hypothetical protein
MSSTRLRTFVDESESFLNRSEWENFSMGCDIHLFVEHEAYDWEKVYRPVKDERGWVENYYGYEGRNYDLFAILAGVRRDEPKPIAEPRGLPEDVSADVKRASEEWDSDGHTHSWYSLAELLAFDWDKPFTAEERWVDATAYDSWDKKGYPPSSCGWASHSLALTEGEYADLKGSGKPIPERTYIKMNFQLKYRDAAEHFLSTTVERLKELDPDPTKVRIVFWFDN